MSIYFLIVNYYSSTFIERLLVSSEIQKKLPKVIIINNSIDDELSDLQNIYENLLILTAPGNVGFGQGCNLGLSHIYHQSPEAHVWLLNPDAYLKDGAIEYVQLCLASQEDIAILGTRIYDSRNQPWFVTGSFNPWLGALSHQGNLNQKIDDLTSESLPQVLPSRWVSGCSLIINLASFNHCPQFDPKFFLYYEDSELCERYYQKGYRVAVTKSFLVIHDVSSITGKNLRFKWKNAVFSKLYFLRNFGYTTSLVLNYLYFLVKSFHFKVLGKHDLSQGYWEGIRMFRSYLKGL